MSTSSAQTTPEVYYPESDGKPMGETSIHVETTLEIFGTLKGQIFRGLPDVFVTADIFFYYEQGNPKAVKAPDVLVARGVQGNHHRRTYKLWVEKVPPCVIFEVTSDETRRDDTIIKRDLYARLGVAEYYLFDPLGEYLDPPLRGFRLEGDHYLPITPGPDGGFESPRLGLRLRAEGTSVRFLDPRTNDPIPSCFEQIHLAEDRKKDIEILERDMAEKRDQIEKARKKAAREEKKAKLERQKAETERQKAKALEAEVKRLRELLEGRGPDDPVSPRS